ncbi:MAG: hypothetical protein WA655_20185 [Candidatus Korobacteraceae bacterium]
MRNQRAENSLHQRFAAKQETKRDGRGKPSNDDWGMKSFRGAGVKPQLGGMAGVDIILKMSVPFNFRVEGKEENQQAERNDAETSKAAAICQEPQKGASTIQKPIALSWQAYCQFISEAFRPGQVIACVPGV